MRSRFAAVAEGAAGAVLVDEPGDLDLEQAIVNGDFVVFNLDAAQDLEAAQFVANLVISDFVSTIARLGHEGWHIDPATGQQNRLNLLVVDEFAALGATGLIDAVERSRVPGWARRSGLPGFPAPLDLTYIVYHIRNTISKAGWGKFPENQSQPKEKQATRPPLQGWAGRLY